MFIPVCERPNGHEVCNRSVILVSVEPTAVTSSHTSFSGTYSRDFWAYAHVSPGYFSILTRDKGPLFSRLSTLIRVRTCAKSTRRQEAGHYYQMRLDF